MPEEGFDKLMETLVESGADGLAGGAGSFGVADVSGEVIVAGRSRGTLGEK
jgi:hypothetical protein